MKTFPKIELHLHIDGSVPPATAWQLAKDQGLPEGELTLEEVTRRMVIQPGENGTDFKEFDLPLAVMQTAPALRQVTACLLYTSKLPITNIVRAENTAITTVSTIFLRFEMTIFSSL